MNDTGYFESLENVSEEQQAAAQWLINVANNEPMLYRSILLVVKSLRHTVDLTAIQLALHRAEWHDDPEAENHAEFHAPAIDQFPRGIRDLAARMLVDYYLNEMAIQEEQA